MAEIDVKIEMAGPLLVGGRKLGTVTETLSYLPGSVLRGALAEVLLQDCPEHARRVAHPDQCPDRANCSFCQLFYPLDGPQPRFGNLYPGSGEVVYPFPATARTCKYHPGFRRDDVAPGERHGIFDVLIRQYTFEQALGSGKPLPFIYLPRCPQCLEKAEPVSESFYSMLGTCYQAPDVLRRRLSRTAVSRRRGTAEEHQLFTLNVLTQQMDTDLLDEHGTSVKEVTTLRGRIWVSDGCADAIQAALQRIERIGAVRSRGMGQVARIETKRMPAIEDLSAMDLFLDQASAGQFTLPEQLHKQSGEPLRPVGIAERLIAFNVCMQAEWRFYNNLGVPLPNAGWYFTINLLSDTILADKGVPTLRLTPDMLGLSEHGLPSVSLERCFVRRVYRSGWSEAYGLPRSVQLAVAMGGVYLYRVQVADRHAIRQLLEKLKQLEQDGLGGERERGYGHVMVCLPFHLEVEGR